MTGEAAHIGQRIRTWRLKQGRSQAVIAGLVGITEDYLSRIERGRRLPTIPVLLLLARELGVEPSALLDAADSEQILPGPDGSIDADVAACLLRAGITDDASTATSRTLRERVDGVWQLWQTSHTRFTDAAALLPALIADVESARRRSGTEPAERREIQRCAADLYGLLRSYCRRTGSRDLGLLVADRAMRAAEDADDPIRMAAATWNLGHMLLNNDQSDGAEETAVHTIGSLSRLPASREVRAVIGALELVAVVAATRQRQWWRARERLSVKAFPAARQVGESNVLGTVFGPTNVQLHALSIEMEAGNTSAALHVADTIETGHLPIERRFTFLLEVARCYDLDRDDAGAFVTLLDIEQMAPEDLTRSPLARQIITDLRDRSTRTYRRQISALAEHVGVA